MSARRSHVLRTAALAAVNAFFDALDAAERETPKRAPTRPQAEPANEVSAEDRAAAEREVYRWRP
jgi:hypothetical protein